MPLSIALVFHFNQHTNEFAAVANRACYRGLLKVLRAHPRLKFNLHLSGTLLRALNWFDPLQHAGAENVAEPGTLDMVRAGLADGQFELLGSTYAQNIPYACDDWDNAQQIGLHRAVLERLFGVQPAVFWNSERCWRQSLVPLIAAGGYRATLVEDHILRAAGLADPLPVRTRRAARALTLIYDDTIFRERFNYAAWFGRRAQLFNYLDQLAARPGAEDHLVAYAEDAEAMGLWPWEAGYLPHAAWANLDRLLTDLEERLAADAYALVHLSSARARQDLGPVPDGSARWMDRALRQPDAPYHEDGYRHWFDYLQHSPKVHHFRKLYAVVRSNLKQVGEARQDPGFPRLATSAADIFYRQAIETYCSHQYEFGCIGVGGRGYWGWENVRAAFLYTRLAEIAEHPEPRLWIEDLNGDGSDEQVLCDGRQLAVLTAYGGRLLGWFDLSEGRQWVGNPLAVPSAPYVGGASEHPKMVPPMRRWLPETFEADLKPWREQKVKEPAPTRLGRHLSPELFGRELFARDVDEVTVYVNPAPDGESTGGRAPERVLTGALNDWLAVDGGDRHAADGFLDYRFEPDGIISYLNVLIPGLKIDKRVRLTPGGLLVQYVVENQTRRRRRLRWSLSSELAPDYGEVLIGGRAALDWTQPEGGWPGVVNTRTRTALVIRPSRDWLEQGQQDGLLGLDLWLTFALDLPAQGVETIEVALEVVRSPAPASAT